MKPPVNARSLREAGKIAPWRAAGKLLTLALLAVLLTGGSCARAGELARLHRELTSPQEADVPVSPDAPPAPPQPPATPGVLPLQPLPQRPAVPAIVRLGFESLPCRGSCPVFTVIFRADGTFRYLGEENVERVGEGSGTVPRHFLEMIMRYVEAVDFRGLRDSYPSPLADTRTTYTMVEWATGLKVIENQDGAAPATVWALERLLLDLLAEATWD